MPRAKEKILRLLEAATSPLTQREISRKTGLSRPSVRSVTSKLEEEGEIEIEEAGNAYLHRRVEDET